MRVYRFVNNRDLVPRIPSVNYQHAGVLLWLRRKRKQAKNEEAPAATGAESAVATQELLRPRSGKSTCMGAD